MYTKKFITPDRDGIITVMDSGECEYKDPIDIFRNDFLNSRIAVHTSLIALNKEELAQLSQDEQQLLGILIAKTAEEDWEKELQKIKDIEISVELLEMLDCRKKKKQIKVLDGIQFSPIKITAFIFAAANMGFTYSLYQSHHFAKNIEQSKMPEMVFTTPAGQLIKHGKTELTPGEIRGAMNQRNSVVAKFIDRKDIWHCFFYTYAGIAGEEEGHGPHMHYISSAFGMPREVVLKELKSRKYNLPALHIFMDKPYRNSLYAGYDGHTGEMPK